MRLQDYTAAEDLIAGLPARNREDCIARICEHLHRRGKIQDPAALTEEILGREQLESTAIGGGIALPHVRSEQVPGAMVAIAQLAEPIDFNAMDGAPVDLVFLLLGAKELPGQHLRVLARISKLVRDYQFLSGLRDAESVAAVATSLEETEARLG